MKKINNIKGSLPLLVTLILGIMTVVLVKFTKSNQLDRFSIISHANKQKTDMMVDHGLTLYMEDLVDFYINKKDLIQETKNGFNKEVYIPNEELRDIKYKYEYDTESNVENNIKFQNKKRTETSYYDYKFYDMRNLISDDVDNQNKFLLLKDSGGSNLRIFSGSSDLELQHIISTNINSNFVILVYYDDIDGDDNIESQLQVNIMSGLADNDNSETIILKDNILIKDLYKKKDANSQINKLSLGQKIKICSGTLNSNKIYLAINNIDNTEIDIFEIDLNNSYGVQELKYINTVVDQFNKFDFKSVVFNDGTIDKEEMFLTLAKDKNIKIYKAYVESSNINFQVLGSTYECDKNIVNISTDVIWDSNMGVSTPKLFVAWISETKDEVEILTMNTEVDGNLVKDNNLIMNSSSCSDINGNDFKVGQMSISAIYNNSNDIRLYVINGVVSYDKIVAYQKNMTSSSNWEKQILEKANDEGIGRLELSRIKREANNYKILLVNPRQVIKKCKIVNKSSNPNIESVAYNDAQIKMSKSTLNPKVSIIYNEEEIGGKRELEKLTVIEYNKNK